MKNYPISRKTNIVVQEFENEVLIYDLSINKAFCLNQTSAMIWELCDGKHSIEQISQILSRKLNQPISDDLIWLALDQFKRDGLLEDKQFEINFHGLNRRQIIKKVGLASMVMLPLISSVVAPTSAMAQSGGLLATCATCTFNSDCANNNCLGLVCSNGTDNSFFPNHFVGSAMGSGTCSPSNIVPACDDLWGSSCCSGAAIGDAAGGGCQEQPGGVFVADCFCA